MMTHTHSPEDCGFSSSRNSIHLLDVGVRDLHARDRVVAFIAQENVDEWSVDSWRHPANQNVPLIGPVLPDRHVVFVVELFDSLLGRNANRRLVAVERRETFVHLDLLLVLKLPCAVEASRHPEKEKSHWMPKHPRARCVFAAANPVVSFLVAGGVHTANASRALILLNGDLDVSFHLSLGFR